jgi:hypothetical protein
MSKPVVERAGNSSSSLFAASRTALVATASIRSAPIARARQ